MNNKTKPDTVRESDAPSEQEKRRKNVHVITFGCQMNQHDSDVVSGLLDEAGYGMATTEEAADIILFNTCCVREHAEQRLYSRISQLKRLKARKPSLLIGVGGCVAQKEKGALTDRFPHVDIVFGPNAIHEIAALVQRAERGDRPVVATPEDGPAPRSDQAIRNDHTTLRAWVSVMRGCDNYCSYCVVPYVRGPQRSKESADIMSEVQKLARQGVREITLLGQNVNSYGQDLPDKTTFARLLESLNDIAGILRIRFTTSHPKDFSRDLMLAIRDLPRVCEHVHLPVQSGSTRILSLMNRGYSAEEYLERVAALRELVPDVGLTTDIIVGFPGETDNDFGQTCHLVEQAQFDGAYIFKYSVRSGTAAARLDGRVEQSRISDRHKNLLDFQKQISLERLKSMVGATQSVLPEAADARRPGHITGRTRGYRVASIPADTDYVGREIDIGVDRLDGWTLMGSIIHPNSNP